MILLGFDMRHAGITKHFHEDYPKGWGNSEPVATWADRFVPLARDLEKAGVDVVNATRETALTCFRRESLEHVLCER
jgi:hypothetical protein